MPGWPGGGNFGIYSGIGAGDDRDHGDRGLFPQPGMDERSEAAEAILWYAPCERECDPGRVRRPPAKRLVGAGTRIAGVDAAPRDDIRRVAEKLCCTNAAGRVRLIVRNWQEGRVERGLACL